MFKKFFNEFDFIGFHSFGFNLVDNCGLHQIRFSPDHPELFIQTQLTHLGRDINSHGSFIWAWRKKVNVVRRVSFDQFSDDQKRKITMKIDLDEKSISLDNAEGISSIEVENFLMNNMGDLRDQIDRNKEGSFPGVFIAARNIINNGEISAEGPDYRTEIITENYEGKGTVNAKNTKSTKRESKKFWEKGWFQTIILLSALATIISVLNGMYPFFQKFNSDSNLIKPFISLIDGTGEYDADTLKLNFIVSNTGNIAARMIDFRLEAIGFPISSQIEGGRELIIAPGEKKTLTGVTFTKEGISENSLPFQVKIEYYNINDKEKKDRYCIQYDLVKNPAQEKIGFENSELCD